MKKISLKAVRVSSGLNQEQWAEKIGVSKVTIVNWEKGRTEPCLSQLKKMSDLSEIPIDMIKCRGEE